MATLLPRHEIAANVETSRGGLVLRMLTVGDLLAFEKHASEPVEVRARTVLKRLLNHPESIGEDLPDEAFDALSADDLLTIAEAARKAYPAEAEPSIEERVEVEPRRPEETGLALFDRVMKASAQPFIERAKESVRKMSAFGGAKMAAQFQELHRTAARLGEPLRSAYSAPEVQSISRPPIADHMEQVAKQGREQREAMLVTKQKTIESAQALGTLVEVATQFMEKLAERDVREERKVRRDLRIALISLLLSTVLAAIGAWYGRQSYLHDLAKDSDEAASSETVRLREVRLQKLLEENAAVMRQNSEVLERLARRAPPPARTTAAAGK